MVVHNFYESIDKKLLKKFPKNEHFDLPFRATFSAPSGAGKSNTVLNLIALLSKCFTKIVVITKEMEPLYEHLKDKVRGVEIRENADMININEYDKDTSKLLILDDLVLEKKAVQAQIGQLYIRGRKLGWSTIYISQSYFGISKMIRINAQEVFLGRNLTQRDLQIICRDFPSDISITEFISLYKSITKEPLSSMRIDIIKRKIFKNLTEYICDL
ncbi:TPA_asm: FtsK [Phytophthora water mold MELD virus]|nr:TPA_asm: FtsK [Phytophthora water mold MELD virus]